MRSRLQSIGAWVRRLDPVTVDRLVAVLLLVAWEIQIWTAAHPHHRVGAAIVAVVPAWTVAVRRRWLLPAVTLAAAVKLAEVAVFGLKTQANGGVVGALTAVVIFYGAGAFVAGWRSWYALGGGVVILGVAALGTPNQVVANLLFNTIAAVLLPWIVGRTSRERKARERAAREAAERLDSERELHVRTAALGERAWLAREIHDVIAHSVSVMVIQSAGARTVMDAEPARAEQSLRAVEQAGREALAEMRRLLGILGDGQTLRALAPQPGLERLDELVARTTAAGLPASLDVQGIPAAVSPGLSLCAYRVIQEALTNSIKHAGPARARVSIRWLADALELEVSDDGDRRAAALTLAESGGHGIAGMRERVALHGGTIEAGPARGGGFAVRVRIPLLVRSAA